MADISRCLKGGEDLMAASVFGQADFNWCAVKVKNTAYPTAQGEAKTSAHAWNGIIYLPGDNYCDDFSKKSPWEQVVFFHELAHCWQQLCDIPASIRSRTQDERIEDGLQSGFDEDGTHHHAWKTNIKGRISVDYGIKTNIRKNSFGQTIHDWKSGWDIQSERLNNFFANDTTEFSRRYNKPRSISPDSLLDVVKSNIDYNYLTHDLCNADFYAMNTEEQASLITDYFCLLNGWKPEVYCYMVSPAARPPINVYKELLPFPT